MTSVSDENIDEVWKLASNDHQLIVREIVDELQFNRESARQIVTQNLEMEKKRITYIDEIPNIQRNVTRRVNSIPKEDFLQSFKGMYRRSQRLHSYGM
ncbi:hypothetical protein TNCV_4063471 [Trichonephila clavipes]|nr:hypothetical protein TNCV_4063471 [Trichonephila clavipes]